jgi:hypothetical protein
MSITDKLVTEWAFRCKKGYPDLNNPQDMQILREIYSEYGLVMEEEKPQQQSQENNTSFEDLQGLIAARKGELTQDQINKLFNTISKTGKGYTTNLLDILINQKKLGKEQAWIIAGYADKHHFEDKVVGSIEDTSNKFTALGTSGNLVTKLADLTSISSTHITTLVDLKTGSGQKGVGRGELAVVSLLHDTKSAEKGDVRTEKGVIEFKAIDAILASSSKTSRGIKVDQILDIIVKTLNIPQQQVATFKTGTNVKGEKWWTDKLINYTQDPKQIQQVLDKLYGNTVKLVDTDAATASALRIRIAKELAKDYIKAQPHPIFFLSTNNNYNIFYTEQEVEDAIGVNLVITKFSDLVPRITYTGQITEK